MNKTYCPFYGTCKDGAFCDLKYTLKVREEHAYKKIVAQVYHYRPECWRSK